MAKKKIWRKYNVHWNEGMQGKKANIISDLEEEDMRSLLSSFDAEIKGAEEYLGKII